MAIQLDAGEQKLGKWTVFLRPPSGDRIGGDLIVTDRRILFDARIEVGVAAAIFGAHRYNGVVDIPKSDVASVAQEKKLLSKKVHVTLTDGAVVTFDYGALSVDKIEAAINA